MTHSKAALATARDHNPRLRDPPTPLHLSLLAVFVWKLIRFNYRSKPNQSPLPAASHSVCFFFFSFLFLTVMRKTVVWGVLSFVLRQIQIPVLLRQSPAGGAGGGGIPSDGAIKGGSDMAVSSYLALSH